MSKWTRLLAVLLCVCLLFTSCAPVGNEKEEYSQEVQNLEKLCKVWGYVQRFHKSRRESTPTSMVNEELDKMIEEMNVTMDAEKRGEMITNIIAKTDELCPFVPIYLVNYFRAYDANLKNVVLGATGYVDFSTMSW